MLGKSIHPIVLNAALGFTCFWFSEAEHSLPDSLLIYLLQSLDERQSLNVWRFLEAINGYDILLQGCDFHFLFEGGVFQELRFLIICNMLVIAKVATSLRN